MFPESFVSKKSKVRGRQGSPVVHQRSPPELKNSNPRVGSLLLDSSELSGEVLWSGEVTVDKAPGVSSNSPQVLSQ
jgi:hypothetical protein